ncbi:ATP-binding protein, partial [Streptomyces sp. NPDC054756]
VGFMLLHNTKHLGGAAPPPPPLGGAGVRGPHEADAEEDEMGLAVISGLVDDVEVSAGEHGGLIRMTWPTAPQTVVLP